jgi:hypothetical protein
VAAFVEAFQAKEYQSSASSSVGHFFGVFPKSSSSSRRRREAIHHISTEFTIILKYQLFSNGLWEDLSTVSNRWLPHDPPHASWYMGEMECTAT